MSRLVRFLRATGGVAAVEFALCAPMFVFLMLATAEIGRYQLLHLKLANAAMSVGDLVARGETASRAEIDLLAGIMPSMLAPFDVENRIALIVSGVTLTAGQTAPTVAWRVASGRQSIGSSRIGAVGVVADVPPGLLIPDEEALVVAEVFYDYEPWLMRIMPGRVIYDVAWYRPRAARLRTLED